MTVPVGKMHKSHKKQLSPIRKAQISLENDINPYPCCVCGTSFRSRYELATHPHGGR